MTTKVRVILELELSEEYAVETETRFEEMRDHVCHMLTLSKEVVDDIQVIDPPTPTVDEKIPIRLSHRDDGNKCYIDSGTKTLWRCVPDGEDQPFAELRPGIELGDLPEKMLRELIINPEQIHRVGASSAPNHMRPPAEPGALLLKHSLIIISYDD
eukprot:SAG11_NODE_10500_length_826_cov_3.503439_1_plen_156_part_00